MSERGRLIAARINGSARPMIVDGVDVTFLIGVGTGLALAIHRPQDAVALLEFLTVDAAHLAGKPAEMHERAYQDFVAAVTTP